MNLSIKEQFNRIAGEYDVNRRKFIPCFDGFYQESTDFLASCITAPEKIIDLGAGTGLLDCFWYQKFPNAEYLLLDIADEMLDIARKRFLGLENVSFQTANYFDRLPANGLDTAISALSNHH
ncbi:MAG: class I SAM-dependent methyltransferase, partial [Oscillospiraceae bacterium]|nr:class I SAM-dependent methyltransferase [Oscillospiraceae bacterium]